MVSHKRDYQRRDPVGACVRKARVHQSFKVFGAELVRNLA